MADSSFEHADEARAALRAIASDPAYGAQALSSAAIMSNLLRDFLPDAPRESGLLTAAAEKDLAGLLRQHVSQGLDVTTAIRLAAASFAASTAFTPDACEWAAAELAIALGLASAGPHQAWGGAGVGPQFAPVLPARPQEPAAQHPEAVPTQWPQPPPTERPDQHWPQPPPTEQPGQHWQQPPTDQPGQHRQQPPGPTLPQHAGAGHHDGTPQASRGPGRGLIAVVGLAVVAVAVAVATIVISLRPSAPAAALSPGAQSSSAGPAPSSSVTATAPSSPAIPGPRAVVQDYLAAINQRDWPLVWQLGGKNLGETYRQMVAGYRLTSRDVVTSLQVSGAAVAVRILAYETTGAVQSYALSYLISGGVIVTGQSTLLGPG